MLSKPLWPWSALLVLPVTVLADYVVDASFKFDVHSHVVPDVYRASLIANGYPVVDGTLFTDGFPVPAWNLSTHIASMNSQGINYSTISISAPGVSFLAKDPHAAASLARLLNLEMYNMTQQYPTRLGAMCILPLPNINGSLAEMKVTNGDPENPQHDHN